ncbi:PepSY domain-containing protein [Salibaculum halophilum]|uniref:PepSY domain-containing protein n=1 Tax=Salibaculum halophilum TaxID=1914408 RepID=UPI000A109B8A|nr:PepSY domain-containing protein [Salibaculum halophilum]
MKTTLLSTTAALALATSPVFAQSATDQIVADLQSQGYTYIEVKEGPSQIKAEAVRDGRKLEVVYDSATGEILKQETEAAEGDYATRTGVEVDSDDEDFLDDDDMDEADDDEMDDERDDEDRDDEERDDEEHDDDEHDDDEHDDEGDEDDEDDDEDDEDEDDDEGEDD